MEEIKLIKDIVASPNADTISNRLMNAKVELDVTRNFLNNASNFCTDDYDMGLSCKMILSKHIEYLQYKVEMLERCIPSCETIGILILSKMSYLKN